ncbi:MAG TPA: hypothetical protein VHM30_17895, partial [Gemmatimonadaceae bacterium]|nr:hypothetical protein [Gemmatimonadaceae bacterium]
DPARADSIADAILDWRDDDDEPRPKGAERAWYRATERLAPRNDAIASSAELLLIRGVSAVGGVDTLLGVEDEGVQLTRAPPAVIASLPGFGSEAIARLEELRFRGEVQGDIPALAAALSPAARDLMLSRYPELSRVIVTEPVAWTLRSRASAPGGVSAALELRLVRAGKRIAIVRRRDT